MEIRRILDFCEENNETVDIVKSFRSDNVKYVYSVPHTFSTTKASATWRACCAMPGAISHVLIADTRNHTKHCRYIVNPPGVDAVVHQHVGVGEGDVDFDALFRTLREMKFAEQTFKVGGEPIVATSLFGYPENEIPQWKPVNLLNVNCCAGKAQRQEPYYEQR